MRYWQTMRQPATVILDPRTLLTAYTQGVFPMADDDGSIGWYTANPRGILPLDNFHIPGTLRQTLRQGRFEIRYDTAFRPVMEACMATRESSWITPLLIDAYVRLYEMGFGHSVECWQSGQLVGGLYGIAIGAAFFGESMFHHVRDASKVALVHLVHRLRDRQFELLDTQATTSHLKRFGAVDIAPEEYLRRLNAAITKERVF